MTAVLLAINDEEKKIKKFMKKMGKLPSNIVIALDNNSVALNQFGTMKVPETFVFNQKGKTLRKFVGPQDWDAPYYSEYLNEILGIKSAN